MKQVRLTNEHFVYLQQFSLLAGLQCADNVLQVS